MMGHNLYFEGEIWKIIHLYPLSGALSLFILRLLQHTIKITSTGTWERSLENITAFLNQTVTLGIFSWGATLPF